MSMVSTCETQDINKVPISDTFDKAIISTTMHQQVCANCCVNSELDKFRQLQEYEFLETIKYNQSLFLGLVIACSYVSVKLAQIAQVMKVIHPPSKQSSKLPPVLPLTDAMTSDQDNTIRSRVKLWRNLKIFNFISEGKKIGEHEVKIACEAKEEE